MRHRQGKHGARPRSTQHSAVQSPTLSLVAAANGRAERRHLSLLCAVAKCGCNARDNHYRIQSQGQTTKKGHWQCAFSVLSATSDLRIYSEHVKIFNR